MPSPLFWIMPPNSSSNMDNNATAPIPSLQHLTEEEMSRLTPSEQLVHSETIIERGLATFYEVGKEVIRIKRDALYPDESWPAYCKRRWGWSVQHAGRLARASEVVDGINHEDPAALTPRSESVTRELRRVPVQDLPDVWKYIVENHGETPTAVEVQCIVEQLYPADSEPIGSSHPQESPQKPQNPSAHDSDYSETTVCRAPGCMEPCTETGYCEDCNAGGIPLTYFENHARPDAVTASAESHTDLQSPASNPDAHAVQAGAGSSSDDATRLWSCPKCYQEWEDSLYTTSQCPDCGHEGEGLGARAPGTSSDSAHPADKAGAGGEIPHEHRSADDGPAPADEVPKVQGKATSKPKHQREKRAPKLDKDQDHRHAERIQEIDDCLACAHAVFLSLKKEVNNKEDISVFLTNAESLLKKYRILIKGSRDVRADPPSVERCIEIALSKELTRQDGIFYHEARTISNWCYGSPAINPVHDVEMDLPRYTRLTKSKNGSQPYQGVSMTAEDGAF